VTIDGATPGTSRGTDVDADGQSVVTQQRLYQLIRQSGQIIDHTFEIVRDPVPRSRRAILRVHLRLELDLTRVTQL
jgi:hypothetical protein